MSMDGQVPAPAPQGGAATSRVSADAEMQEPAARCSAAPDLRWREVLGTSTRYQAGSRGPGHTVPPGTILICLWVSEFTSYPRASSWQNPVNTST